MDGGDCNHPIYALTSGQAAIRDFTEWTSVRKVKEGKITTDLYGFLTCEANGTVGAIHPKAMPVILTEPDEWETWLTAPFDEAKALHRPLPDDTLRIVAEGARRDWKE